MEVFTQLASNIKRACLRVKCEWPHQVDSWRGAEPLNVCVSQRGGGHCAALGVVTDEYDSVHNHTQGQLSTDRSQVPVRQKASQPPPQKAPLLTPPYLSRSLQPGFLFSSHIWCDQAKCKKRIKVNFGFLSRVSTSPDHRTLGVHCVSVRSNSHRTRNATRMQIGTFFFL